jgi:hypothetical protein
MVQSAATGPEVCLLRVLERLLTGDEILAELITFALSKTPDLAPFAEVASSSARREPSQPIPGGCTFLGHDPFLSVQSWPGPARISLRTDRIPAPDLTHK